MHAYLVNSACVQVYGNVSVAALDERVNLFSHVLICSCLK